MLTNVMFGSVGLRFSPLFTDDPVNLPLSDPWQGR